MIKKIIIGLCLTGSLFLWSGCGRSYEAPEGSVITISPSEITITDGSLQDIHKQRFLITVKNPLNVPLNNVKIRSSFIWSTPDGVLDTLVYDMNPCDGTPETPLAQLYDGDPDDGGAPVNSPFNTTTNEDGVFEIWVRFISGGYDAFPCDNVIELTDPTDPTSDPIVFEWNADLEVTSGSSFGSATLTVEKP
jgi:hypothetical protein